MRKALLKFAYPFTHLLGKLSIHRKVDDPFYSYIEKKVRPGDILLSKRRYELSNFFIPGEYTHSAIVTTSEEFTPPMIVESIAEGVVMKSLAKFLFSKDYVMLIRPRIGTEDERLDAGNYARRFIGLPYDYYFEAGVNAFYCSELVNHCYQTHIMEYKHNFEPTQIMGAETVTPMDLYEFFKSRGELIKSEDHK